MSKIQKVKYFFSAKCSTQKYNKPKCESARYLTTITQDRYDVLRDVPRWSKQGTENAPNTPSANDNANKGASEDEAKIQGGVIQPRMQPDNTSIQLQQTACKQIPGNAFFTFSQKRIPTSLPFYRAMYR